MTDFQGQSGTRSIVQRIVTEVASTNGVDPVELEPLYYTIDPDQLVGILDDRALDSAETRGKIAFPYAGCYVEITADGAVEVRRIEMKAAQTQRSDPTASPGADPEPPD